MNFICWKFEKTSKNMNVMFCKLTVKTSKIINLMFFKLTKLKKHESAELTREVSGEVTRELSREVTRNVFDDFSCKLKNPKKT